MTHVLRFRRINLAIVLAFAGLTIASPARSTASEPGKAEPGEGPASADTSRPKDGDKPINRKKAVDFPLSHLPKLSPTQYTVAQLEPEVTIAQSHEVEAKGIKEPVTIHEITGIGAPYNLLLEDEEQQVQPLQRDIPLSFRCLSGKAIADESVSGVLVAAADGVAQLSTTAEIEIMTNLRMNIPGYPGSEDDQIFSKVTDIADRQNEQNQYIIKLTSAPLEARKYIRSLIV